MRSDIHKPSSIVPAHYAFVALGYQRVDHIEQCMAVAIERARLAQHMVQTGGQWSQHEHGGNCDVCGAHCIYTAVFYHQLTNSYIRTGLDCADKLHMACGNPDAFKRSVREAIEALAGKRKAEALLVEAGLLQAFALWQSDVKPTEKREEGIIRGMVGKLVRYGSISDKTIAYMRLLVAQLASRPALEARRAQEHEAAANCPRGRVTITGEVVKVEGRQTQFGYVTKMTVKDRSGFLVWSTVPAGMNGVARGSKVSFVATVEPSANDPKFGFAKRPVATSQPTLGLEPVR